MGDWKTPILKNPDAASNAPGAGGKADAPPALPPINPVEALRQLAAAVSEAEQTLNQQNLVVATGTMDVELNVDVGGVLGAHAKLSLKIEPKPYV